MINKEKWHLFNLIFSSLFLLDSTFAAKADPTASFSDSFTNGSVTCQIKLKKTFVVSPLEKLEYSVYCNNKFVHADSYDGGTLIGCRQPLEKPEAKNPLQPLILNGKKSGWWVVTGESCGTLSFSKYALVYPLIESGSANGYVTKAFTSNFPGIVAKPNPSKKTIQVWYGRYVYCGAMANSIVVPHVDTITLGTDYSPDKLPANFSAWPKEFEPSYQTAFLAGMADQNIAVLESAKKLLDKDTFKNKEECFVNGLPRTPQKMDEIINALKSLEANHVAKYLGAKNDVDGET